MPGPPDCQPESLQKEIATWEVQRNQSVIGANWTFTTDEAQVKLQKLYSSFLG